MFTAPETKIRPPAQSPLQTEQVQTDPGRLHSISDRLGGTVSPEQLAVSRQSYIEGVAELVDEKLTKITGKLFYTQQENVVHKVASNSKLLKIADQVVGSISEKHPLDPKQELRVSNAATTFVSDYRETALKIAEARHKLDGPAGSSDYSPSDPTSLLTEIAGEDFDRRLLTLVESLENISGREVIGKVAQIKRIGRRTLRFATTGITFNAPERMTGRMDKKLQTNLEKDAAVEIAVSRLYEFIGGREKVKKIPTALDKQLHEDIKKYRDAGHIDDIIAELVAKFEPVTILAQLNDYMESTVLPQVLGIPKPNKKGSKEDKQVKKALIQDMLGQLHKIREQKIQDRTSSPDPAEPNQPELENTQRLEITDALARMRAEIDHHISSHRKAGNDDKSIYRILLRKYHPDVSDNPNSEELIRYINSVFENRHKKSNH
jgi:hypothetical protein